MAIRYSSRLISSSLTVPALVAALLCGAPPIFADPIVTIEEKGHGFSSAESSPLQARRSAWIAELDRTRSRVKRRTGVDLDIELAKLLCRDGALERCEEAVVELQSQVTILLTTSTSPRTPPAPPEPPQSNTSVVILTQPRHHYRHEPTDLPSALITPNVPGDRRAHHPRHTKDTPSEPPTAYKASGSF